MGDEQILNASLALLNKFRVRCHKFGGAAVVEIIRDALLAEGFNVSDRDVFIEEIPIELDLLIARQGVSPERRILFRAEDVLMVLEIKSRGAFGEQTLKNVSKNFRVIRNFSKRIECVYLALSERESYKWKATDKNINSPVYTLF